jgi:hypothetical protein
MNPIDFKKAGVLLTTLLTAFFECLINLVPQLYYRQILNPIGIGISIVLSIFIMHRMKRFAINLLIKTNEEEIANYLLQREKTPNNNLPAVEKLNEKIQKCENEIIKLRRDKNKIDFFH